MVVAADDEGVVWAARGDPNTPVHLRSAAKPFQAYALVASGAADRLGVTEEELAVACGSHLGEEQHIEVVGRLLRRVGMGPELLECGAASPLSGEAAAALRARGLQPTALHHTCSGKHAGMVALAVDLGVDVQGYPRPDHPVQELIATTIRGLLGDLSPGGGDLRCGTDGCGVPVFRLPAAWAATLYARLAAGRDPVYARLSRAMAAYPALVRGFGNLDTEVMRAAASVPFPVGGGEAEPGGVVVAKMGNMGVQGFGIPAMGRSSSTPASPGRSALTAGAGRARGCFIKIADGSSFPVAALTSLVLRSWGFPEVAEAALSTAPSVPSGGELRLLFGEDDLEAQPRARRQAGEDYTVVREDAPRRRTRRFLGDRWPGAEEELFGRALDWTTMRAAWVASRGQRVVGVLRGSWAGGVATVEEVLVEEGFRGRGLGSALLAHFERDAHGAGCRKVVLATKPESRAERFYRRHGYVRSYLIPCHHHCADSLGMSKWLEPAVQADQTGTNC